MTTETATLIRDIKQSFRLMMDGSTAQSMRQKGLEYRVNWGATLPRLREKAEELRHDTLGDDDTRCYELAKELWKEDGVRECRILATMLMPPALMEQDMAELWMEQTPTVEIAEQAAFNVYQHLPFAGDIAYRWIAAEDDLRQITGYHILSRLFTQGMQPNERGINEFTDQALSAMQSQSLTLRKAAMQAMLRFADMGLVYERIANGALRRIGLSL